VNLLPRIQMDCSPWNTTVDMVKLQMLFLAQALKEGKESAIQTARRRQPQAMACSGERQNLGVYFGRGTPAWVLERRAEARRRGTERLGVDVWNRFITG
jgi:hypothetical protein